MLWSGLLGLVVLWFFALLMEAPNMEREIGADVLRQLQSAGYRRVGAEVSGRDVTLTGAVSGRHAAGDAALIAAEVAGVRRIRDATVDAPLTLSWLRASRSARGEWRLRGRLSDRPSRDVVKEAFGIGGSLRVEGLMVDPEAAAAMWLPAMKQILDLVGVLEDTEIEVGGGNLEVAGELVDKSQYTGLINALEVLADAYGLRLVNRVATFAEMR